MPPDEVVDKRRAFGSTTHHRIIESSEFPVLLHITAASSTRVFKCMKTVGHRAHREHRGHNDFSVFSVCSVAIRLCEKRCRARRLRLTRYLVTNASQSPGASFSPEVMAKKSFCSCAVMGPRFPLPILERSMLRMGVISAAVPVKKTSSAT